MEFYTNVSYNRKSDLFYVRGYSDGVRFDKTFPCKPFIFYEHDEGEFNTIDGIPVKRQNFSSRKHLTSFLEKHQGISNLKIHGFGPKQFELTYAFINEMYPQGVQYNFNDLSIVYMDIETDSEGGFGNTLGDKEIISITIRKDKTSVVFGLKDWSKPGKNVLYVKCVNEEEILRKFLKVWKSEKFSPDIISGWNIEFFDIPVIMARLDAVLGPNSRYLLSPYGFNTVRYVPSKFSDSLVEVQHPAGINVLDYFSLYKKFVTSARESYKLDYIARYELNKGKVDYEELGYDTLDEFYKKDPEKFYLYNLIDAGLVQELDDKLKFIRQACTIAYDAKVNPVETLTTVRIWDVIIHNYLLNKKIVVPYVDVNEIDDSIEEKDDDEEGIVGAYVKPPQIGLFKWIVAFDLDSLYPHLIMQYNISPDTFIKKIQNVSVDSFLEKDEKYQQLYKIAVDSKCGITPSGCVFTNEIRGFLPELMDQIYSDRSQWKRQMIEYQKQYEKQKSDDLSKLVSQASNMQNAKKIQLNSAYGALANKNFRWYRRDLAETITTGGQLSIRYVVESINRFLNDTLNTSDFDYVIAGDTDSMYLNLERVVDMFFEGDVANTSTVITFLDNFVNSRILPQIDSTFKDLHISTNAFDQKMRMKREMIGDKGVWTGKKHYVVNVWDNEGVQYKQPVLKMKGIEAVKSSTPQVCRSSFKKALQIVMTGDQNKLYQFIDEFRETFNTLPFESVAFPRGVSNLVDKKDGYNFVKGCPINVRGSIIYNDLIKQNKLEYKYPFIVNGDKVKFCYLTVPNPLRMNVIATPGKLPKEFKLDQYIDYETQFSKAFLKPLETVLTAIGWTSEEVLTVDSLF